MKTPMQQAAICLLALLAPLAASAAEPTKVGFVYFGPVGDVGWTYQHDQGRKALEQALGNKIVVKTVPNTFEGPDGDRVVRDLTENGTKIIFAVGFGYMRDVLRIAADNPDKCFTTASAYMTAPNASGYGAKWHEGGYLAGIVAGKMAKNNVIGFVGANPVPDVMWYLNALVQGARSVNPKATVKAVFVGSWSDPPKETDAATALLNQGVDVMTHYTNSPAVVTAADARGVPTISFHSDMRRYAPKHYLTGVTHEWSDYYIKFTKDALEGKCKGSLYFGGIKEGNIKMAPMGPQVPKDVVDLVAAKTKDIAEGRLKVFAGPIRDNKGAVRVAAGSAYPDADLGKMDWYAEGIIVGQH
ncbi:BMP family ABC transporter substrate-binding protein [Pelomonas sp. KK5]|uniref:BMP family ABC transporter substrate-binding protein n=1 Tax=Pelomonas sp. KK5 TaxID=1855730 RepID=UPI00097C9649|nr:BMP family ABC transporter substrate-binding protein [Pelomonas sp. KK5]